MDFQPDIAVPSEPSTLALFLTGMLTITAYLVMTGKWHLLIGRASEAPTGATRPVDPSRLAILGLNGQYTFCRYESQFAHSLAKIISVAEETDSSFIVRRPSDMRIAPCQMAPLTWVKPQLDQTAATAPRIKKSAKGDRPMADSYSVSTD